MDFEKNIKDSLLRIILQIPRFYMLAKILKRKTKAANNRIIFLFNFSESDVLFSATKNRTDLKFQEKFNLY